MHVIGYYPTTGGDVFRPTKPLRLYDSRRDPAGPLVPGAQRAVTLPTLSGIPAASMTGALLNVTALSATGRGARHGRSPRAATAGSATVSLRPRAVRCRTAPWRGSQGGTFELTGRDATAHVVVDVVGWWAPQAVMGGRLFQPRAAARVLDTRTGRRRPAGPGGRRRRRHRAGRRQGQAGPGRCPRRRDEPHRGRPVAQLVRDRVAQRRGARRPSRTSRCGPGGPRPTSSSCGSGRRTGSASPTGPGSTHLVGDVVGYYP